MLWLPITSPSDRTPTVTRTPHKETPYDHHHRIRQMLHLVWMHLGAASKPNRFLWRLCGEGPHSVNIIEPNRLWRRLLQLYHRGAHWKWMGSPAFVPQHWIRCKATSFLLLFVCGLIQQINPHISYLWSTVFRSVVLNGCSSLFLPFCL